MDEKDLPPEEVQEKIIEGTALVRKPSRFRRFRRSFIAGDAQSVSEHVFWNLVVPGLQNVASELSSTFVDMMIYGEKRPRIPGQYGGVPIQGPGSTTKVNYTSISQGGRLVQSQQHHAPAIPVRQKLNPNEIIVNNVTEAEIVITALIDKIARFKIVTVATLYTMIGESGDMLDHKWGWTDLSEASWKRLGSGAVLLLLPPPVDLTA